MPKYTLWSLIALLALVVLGIILWLAPQSNPAPDTAPQAASASAATTNLLAQPNSGMLPAFASKSQQDTEINCQMSLDGRQRLIVNEQTRNCFEYFITQYGEKSIQQIQQDFQHYIQQNYQEPSRSLILDLWNRYLDYRQSLAELTAPTGIAQDDPAYYRSIYQSTQNLRKKFFDDVEIKGLFGTEDRYHEYTLDRMQVLADKKLSEAEKAKKLQALFQELPQDWQENLEQLNKLDDLRKLTADIKSRGGSSAEIRQMRLNLVGPEATQRLEQLDTERADWKNSVTDFLAQRDTIIQSGMSEQGKQQALQQLRQQHFKRPEDRLRVETFEQLHDQGSKLPFAD